MSRSRSSPPALMATAPPAGVGLARAVRGQRRHVADDYSAGRDRVGLARRQCLREDILHDVGVPHGSHNLRRDDSGRTRRNDAGDDRVILAGDLESSGWVMTTGVALGAAPMNVPSCRSRSSKKSTCDWLPSPADLVSSKICDSAGDMTCSSVSCVLQYPSPRDGIVSKRKAHAIGEISSRSGLTKARAASPAGGHRHPRACAAWRNAQH